MLQCFNPIVDENSKVLILGSMPGVKSLKESEYYAHPRNAFWKIMNKMFDTKAQTYEEKIELLRYNQIALWDVLKHCHREGSLDSDIKKESIIINDFKELFKNYPRIKVVFFNGGTAYNEFKKRVLKDIKNEFDYLSFYRLPSTSPANAKMKFDEKYEKWLAIKSFLADNH